MFRQYIKNKRHKYGVKLYELCESNGIVLRISVYSGEGYSDQDNLGQTGAIVQYLLDDILDKGYHVFTDNYYNSIPLTEVMTARFTYITGTLNKKRVGIPYPIKRLQLVRGEHCWMRSGSTVVCKWKDKREVLTITNAHKVEMCDVMNNRGKVSQKPNVVADYNNGMSGIDLSDQMISYYSNLRKTLKWYRKVALQIIEVLLNNSYYVFKKCTGKQMTMLTYRETIVNHLIGLTDDVDFDKVPKANFHYLEPIPPTASKANPTRKCVLCKKADIRKESRYQCGFCEDKVALCIHPCFKNYHVKLQ